MLCDEINHKRVSSKARCPLIGGVVKGRDHCILLCSWNYIAQATKKSELLT